MKEQAAFKKKILFLSFNYPYGKVGASTMCSYQIIKALCVCKQYEVHCISYDGDKTAYEYIPQLIIHKIPHKNKDNQSKISKILSQISHVITYPIKSLYKGYIHYKYCSEICREEKFDLVIAQYFPEQCLIAGILLKKKKIINNLMVIFWDIIYGKIPQNKLFNKRFAIYRQRKVETQIAKYADLLVSLYPIKEFHEKYGDVKHASEKRFYLGIPSVLPPEESTPTPHLKVLDSSKINILFSGIIIKEHTLEYIVSLFNALPNAQDLNLIFFSKGISDIKFDDLRNNFQGKIINTGYIPLKELHSIYREVDFFLSLPGNPNSICSKCYDYMSYGRPIILVQEVDGDVNVTTFSRYPRCLSLNMQKDRSVNINNLNEFIKLQKGQTIPFNVVEDIYKMDTPKAYISLINNYFNE